MNILETIIAKKREEVKAAKAQITIQQLEAQWGFRRKNTSLAHALRTAPYGGFIAEHKRKSPSKGVINARLQLEEIINGYVTAGASGLSVLTDTPFFGGTPHDLQTARALHQQIPILRKDFMIDTYQIAEAKAWGADVILLIAACLEPKQIAELASYAHNIGLEVLLEVHDRIELEQSLGPNIDMIGVNNRNLRTFEVRIETSMELAASIPETVVKVAESGIQSADEICSLLPYGYKGFLIGESFMKTNNPGAACAQLLRQVSIKAQTASI